VCSNDLALFTPPRKSPTSRGVPTQASPVAQAPPPPPPPPLKEGPPGRTVSSPYNLGATADLKSAAEKVAAHREFAELSQEELMEQARNYVCRSCSSGVPTGHKFCGRCGTAVPPEILNAQVLFFGDMQNPAKAKLILIRGEGMDGLSFHLKAEQHIVGRNGQLVFPDDPFVSPKHPSPFRLTQILQGGAVGMTVCARGGSLQIGREGGDLNFPVDLYMSSSHCRLEEQGGKFFLTDLNSRNGTYIRIKTERELTHGDYLFIGRKLLRVELNTN
ncbi:MAG TPA: FHA domain-containing protein, partial [Polyangiaceae bacterium]|nr:FHA domain-containing protein [Polyangiaceae bacterium]